MACWRFPTRSRQMTSRPSRKTPCPEPATRGSVANTACSAAILSGLKTSRGCLASASRRCWGQTRHTESLWMADGASPRTHYRFQHERCWYVRKKHAPWFGEAGKCSTIWDSPSPKFIMGGSDEDKFDHPTQKPVDLMRRPILNPLKRGELVYGPFLGSGTTLAAAELTERVCFGLELDPKHVDGIIERWQTLSGKKR